MEKVYTNPEIAKAYLQKFGGGGNFHPAKAEFDIIKSCDIELYPLYMKNKSLNGIQIRRTWGRLQTRQLEEVLAELTR